MSIINEEIIGTKIINKIKSSNILKTEYDTQNYEMVVEFKTGGKYKYSNVPHNIYTQFRMSDSQGKFFSKNIAKKYSYVKL